MHFVVSQTGLLAIYAQLLELLVVELLGECPFVLSNILDLLVKLLIVVLHQVCVDGAQDAREGLTVQLEKAAFRGLDANTERPLIVVDEG